MKRIDQYSIALDFEKEDEDWFAVIPEYKGSHADLQMVCGADVMCNILDINGEADGKVRTILTIDKIDIYKVKLVKYQETPEIGGALYIAHWSDHYGLSPFQVWLCDVTKYVFGILPGEIYIK